MCEFTHAHGGPVAVRSLSNPRSDGARTVIGDAAHRDVMTTTTTQYEDMTAEEKFRFIDPHALIQTNRLTSSSVRTVWLSGYASPLDRPALRTLAHEAGVHLVEGPRRAIRPQPAGKKTRRTSRAPKGFTCRIYQDTTRAQKPARAEQNEVTDQEGDRDMNNSIAIIFNDKLHRTLRPMLPVITDEHITQIALDGLQQENWPVTWPAGSKYLRVEAEGLTFPLAVRPVLYEGVWGVVLFAAPGRWEDSAASRTRVRHLEYGMGQTLGRFMAVDIYQLCAMG